MGAIVKAPANSVLNDPPESSKMSVAALKPGRQASEASEITSRVSNTPLSHSSAPIPVKLCCQDSNNNGMLDCAVIS